ncbi:hypothetical protein B7463_g8686, partial [Scytalidium lignicola]
MDEPPPPPPPPHGEMPKSTSSSGLPPGNYDIFIIPPHSSGSGFLYLPSLQPNVNSFVAGFASALILVVVGSAIQPALKSWWNSANGSGGAGTIMFTLAIGLGAWSIGRAQTDGGFGFGRPGAGFGGGYGGGFGGRGSAQSNGGPTPPPHGQSSPPRNSHANGHAHGPPPGAGPYSNGGGPRQSWQQRGAPDPGASGNDGGPGAGPQPENTPKGGWEKAREETRKKEEERKAKEAEKKRKEELEKKLREAREREARERERREREARERDTKEREAREAREREVREKETREREAREKEAREKELREKEAREKEAREREARLREARLKEARDKEARETWLREAREREAKGRLAREKEAREREAKEKEARAREALEKEIRERIDRDRKLKEEALKRRSTTYAFSAIGEKTNPWPNGRPAETRSEVRSPSPTKNPTTQSPSTPKSRPPQQASPTKNPPPQPPPNKNPSTPSPTKNPPPPPTARTARDAEDDAYSYRPYDKPKRATRHRTSHSSVYSESSYAASQSTTPTTPPPSHRGPYSTKDPDKIVIKGVYAFNNAFLKTPTSQLISGVAPVTDGLILRITTEGLFIDDDIRGVPQREWDVKAWTMKLVEVWCPHFSQDPAGKSASASARASLPKNPVRRVWNLDKERAISAEETNTLLADLLTCCNDNCRFASSASDHDSVYSASSYGSSSRSSTASDSTFTSSVSSSRSQHHRHNRSRDQTNHMGASSQTGELKSAGFHILRASLRDQEGKKYVFVITQEESWKLALGLQRLRKGSQVRALGVSGMTTGEARGLLENLGWT